MDRTSTLPLDHTALAASSTAPRAFLEVHAASGSAWYPLLVGETQIGRAGTAGVAVPLAAVSVSRSHAVIESSRTRICFIEDLKSTNKTHFRNGPDAVAEVPPGRRYQLTDGRGLRFGAVDATFRTTGPATDEPLRAATMVFHNTVPEAEDDVTTELDGGDAAEAAKAIVLDDEEGDVPVVSKRQGHLDSATSVASSPAVAATVPVDATLKVTLDDDEGDEPMGDGSPEASATPPPLVRKALLCKSDAAATDGVNGGDAADGPPAPLTPSAPPDDPTAVDPILHTPAASIPDVMVGTRAPPSAADPGPIAGQDSAGEGTAEEDTEAPKARRPPAPASAVSSSSSSAADISPAASLPKRSLRSAESESSASPSKRAKPDASPKPKPSGRTGRSAKLAGLTGDDDDDAPKAKWWFKKDLRLRDDKEEGWAAYSIGDTDAIEKAFRAKKESLLLNDKYTINLKEMMQYRNDDSYKQRPVRRIEGDE